MRHAKPGNAACGRSAGVFRAVYIGCVIVFNSAVSAFTG